MQPFTREQRACIIGGLLGDLHIQKSLSNSGNCRLRFSHSWKQKDYLYWKYNLFKDNFCQKTKPPFLVETNKAKGGENLLVESAIKYKNYLFYTHYKESLKTFHSDWYIPTAKDSLSDSICFVKKLPLDLAQTFIDPLALAIWYLDDGTKRTDTNSCRFASNCFSEEEHLLLCDCMYLNFGITAKIESWSRTRMGKTAYSLAILSKGGHYQKFRDLLYPIVKTKIPSMLYKLSQTP